MSFGNPSTIRAASPDWENPEIFHDVVKAKLGDLAKQVLIETVPFTNEIVIRRVSMELRPTILDVLKDIGAAEIDPEKLPAGD